MGDLVPSRKAWSPPSLQLPLTAERGQLGGTLGDTQTTLNRAGQTPALAAWFMGLLCSHHLITSWTTSEMAAPQTKEDLATFLSLLDTRSFRLRRRQPPGELQALDSAGERGALTGLF